MVLAVQLPPLHTGQVAIRDHPARFKVVANGRRWGKTTYGVYVAARGGLLGGRIWWVSVTYRLALEGWNLLKELALQVPGARIREKDFEIRWPSGGRTEVRSADNPQSLRGAGLDGLVLDEAAFVHPDAWAQSLRPALADKQGWALFISTPRGRNWFWQLYKDAQDGTMPDAAAFTARTVDNPFIRPSEVDEMRRTMSTRAFRQEAEASFESVEGALWEIAWIDHNRVHALPIDTRTHRPVRIARRVLSIDPAVTASDLSDETAMSVQGIGTDGDVYVFELQAFKLSPHQWANRALDYYLQWDCDTIVAEVNNGGDMVEEVIRRAARDRRISVNYTAVHASKGKLTRAEPCAADYEHGHVHHVGYFYEAEDQMITFPIENTRDDLVDALVWGWTELREESGILETWN